MKRILTAAVATPIVLGALFFLPAPWFLAFVVALLMGAVVEYVAIARARVPGAPLRALFVLVPVASAILAFGPDGLPAVPGVSGPRLLLVAVAAFACVGIGMLLLWGRTPVEETFSGLGSLGFGVPYFALPAASLYYLKTIDPWLVFLLFAIVWLGDSAAFYAGSRFGRHKMSPSISPNKSWEGAASGIAMGLLSTAVWCWFRLGRMEPGLFLVAAVTAVAAIAGDLVESMIKRGAGVKDSGHILPGHGGFLDRADATLFAAPVYLLGIWLLALDFPTP
jgi:phosphatidate cytidylyltransferase